MNVSRFVSKVEQDETEGEGDGVEGADTEVEGSEREERAPSILPLLIHQSRLVEDYVAGEE